MISMVPIIAHESCPISKEVWSLVISYHRQQWLGVSRNPIKHMEESIIEVRILVM